MAIQPVPVDPAFHLAEARDGRDDACENADDAPSGRSPLAVGPSPTGDGSTGLGNDRVEPAIEPGELGANPVPRRSYGVISATVPVVCTLIPVILPIVAVKWRGVAVAGFLMTMPRPTSAMNRPAVAVT
jgi:hypothetical protein